MLRILSVARSSSVDPPRLSTKAEATKEFLPGLATTTEVCSVNTIFREFAQLLRDLLREDLIAQTRGVQGVQRPSFKVIEEGIEQTAQIAESAVQEKFQIKDLQGEVHQPTDKLRSSVGGSDGGRRSFNNNKGLY